MWWKENKKADYGDDFFKIIDALVFNCPSSIRNGSRYKNVSARKCSFRERGVQKELLTILLREIKSPLMKNKAYQKIGSSDSVEEAVSDILKNSELSDSNFEIIVFQKRREMSDVENIYYCIRNAFAQGSFEVTEDKIYKLECKKGERIKAQMRLKESTLMQYAKLARMKPNQIRKLQNS